MSSFYFLCLPSLVVCEIKRKSVRTFFYFLIPLVSPNDCHCKIYGNFVWCFYWICLKNSIHAFIWTCSRLPVSWATFFFFCFIGASSCCFFFRVVLWWQKPFVIQMAYRHKYIDENPSSWFSLALFLVSLSHTHTLVTLCAHSIYFPSVRKFVYIRAYRSNAIHTHIFSLFRLKYK